MIKFLDNKKNIFAIFCLFSICLSWQIGWFGFLFFFFSIFIAYILIFSETEPKKIIIHKYFLLIPIIIFFISRLLPFTLYGPHPLGYDTGFYKYNISNERTNSFGNLHLSVVESTGSRIINKALIATGFSDEAIMYWVQILTGFLTGLMIYLLTKKYFGESAAFFSAFLFSISSVQYLFYWNFFWKNSLTIFLILLIFYQIEKNKKWLYCLIIPEILFVFITHKTSAFILFATLLAYFLLQKDKRKFWIIPFLLIGGAIVSWYNWQTIVYLYQQITSNFSAHYDFFSVQEGLFIEQSQFISFSLLYLPFGLLGLLQSKKKNLILLFSLICAIIIIIKFVFFKRIFPYLDIGLLIFAGGTLVYFLEKISGFLKSKYVMIFLFFILSLPTFLFLNFVKSQKPLMAQSQIEEIEDMQKTLPTIKILTNNSYFTPWLYGFSGHKIIAPGWGDDKWNLEKWQIFWSSDVKTKKEMLAQFKQPLIVYTTAGLEDLKKDECFQKIEENFYLYNNYCQ